MLTNENNITTCFPLKSNLIILNRPVRETKITRPLISSRLVKCGGSVTSIIRYHNNLFDKSPEFTRSIMSYPLLKQAWTNAEGNENNAFRALFNHTLYYFLEKERPSSLLSCLSRQSCIFFSVSNIGRCLCTL